MTNKPLGHKGYGSIPHLPGSRTGPGDHMCHEGQKRIATEKTRDRHDFVVVQEKLDGSNVCVAKINGEIMPLTRAGYVANTSLFEQHHIFHGWVMRNWSLFYSFLEEGERICGEWMAQAHGTIYTDLPSPFMAFDIMRGQERATWLTFESRIKDAGIDYIYPLHQGGAISIDSVMEKLGLHGKYGAVEGPEGAVWRVHRNGKVDFLVKYVRPDKKDGIYLPEVSGNPAVWNWTIDDNK